MAIFKKRHTILLVFLVLLDLIATMVWYYHFGISELNPILCGPIESSSIYFASLKLGMSLPSIYLLDKFIYKKIAQAGMAILLLSYIAVSIIHYYLLINILMPIY